MIMHTKLNVHIKRIPNIFIISFKCFHLQMLKNAYKEKIFSEKTTLTMQDCLECKIFHWYTKYHIDVR